MWCSRWPQEPCPPGPLAAPYSAFRHPSINQPPSPSLVLTAATAIPGRVLLPYVVSGDPLAAIRDQVAKLCGDASFNGASPSAFMTVRLRGGVGWRGG